MGDLGRGLLGEFHLFEVAVMVFVFGRRRFLGVALGPVGSHRVQVKV
jgi:hypothetical protein